MNAFATVVFALALASVSASSIGHYNHDAHKPFGIVSANHDNALITGPSGSVHTDNGLHGQGAGAKVSGSFGDVETHEGHAKITGPGYEHENYEHNEYSGLEGHYIESDKHYDSQGIHGVVVAGPSTHATIIGPNATATIVAPSFHAALVAPAAYHSWGHQASAYGHHGW